MVWPEGGLTSEGIYCVRAGSGGPCGLFWVEQTPWVRAWVCTYSVGVKDRAVSRVYASRCSNTSGRTRAHTRPSLSVPVPRAPPPEHARAGGARLGLTRGGQYNIIKTRYTRGKDARTHTHTPHSRTARAHTRREKAWTRRERYTLQTTHETIRIVLSPAWSSLQLHVVPRR